MIQIVLPLFLPLFQSPTELWKETATLSPPAPEAQGEFGRSVSVSGDSAAIGAWREDAGAGVDAGRVHVYVRSAGTWTSQAVLTASNAAAGDEFGRSVSLDGDRLAVGAWGTDVSPTAQDAGSVYLFERSGTSWSEVAELRGGSVAPGELFGRSVALDGDRLAAGTPLHQDLVNGRSSVWVFEWNGASWNECAELQADPADGQVGDEFGYKVALSGERLLVGARRDGAGVANSGAAYLFEGGCPAWTQVAKWKHPSPAGQDRFGRAVAIDADRAIVGARLDDAVFPDEGSAHVYRRDAGGWTYEAFLLPLDPEPGAQFGRNVSIAGPLAVVGANGQDAPGVDSGAAYVFRRSGSAWSQTSKLTPWEGAAGDEHGRHLAVDGTTLIASSRFGDPGGIADAGLALAYELDASMRPFCFGDEQPPGTDCPCDNPSGVGTGQGCRNSRSIGGHATAAGSASVAADDLELCASRLLPNQPALLFAGHNAVNGGSGISFGDGLRCAGGNVVRLGVRVPDPAGGARWGPGLAAMGGWSGGDLRRFQVWYRDPAGSPCGSGFNLSAGIEVAFTP
ncbi:MAG: FG-GAP repeat protein [Planctomycetota bacterium]|nr:FG-GAP repeat protein [Planctomycetota bacterium]